MDTKHTPGPWNTRRTDEEVLTVLGQYNGTTIKIADVYNSIEDETDARLIAAAPELLAMLEKVTKQLAHLYHNGQVSANAPERERIQQYILNAEYAIEKATTTTTE